MVCEVVIFSGSFFHADGIIHKLISVLPSFKDPDADRIFGMIDGLQFIIDSAKRFRNIRFDANHCFLLLHGLLACFPVMLVVRIFRPS